MSKKSTPALLSKEQRREVALKAGVKMARKMGAKRVSIAMVAADQGVTPPLLFHIFGSHAKFVKAVEKAAAAQGVTLPAAAPTIREMRAAAKKAAGKKVKPAAKRVVKPLAKPVAALLKPKVKAIKPMKPVPLPPVAAVRKPLTDAQRKAKQERDRARRAPPATPAQKFAALPAPFEAAIKQVA